MTPRAYFVLGRLARPEGVPRTRAGQVRERLLGLDLTPCPTGLGPTSSSPRRRTRGPPEARAARPDWPVEHWERWAAVRRIALGGGIASGGLGRRLVASATAGLPRLGACEVRLGLADDPGSLALRGAATRLPDGRAVLVDAGLTGIKRGLASVDGGRCVTLPWTRRNNNG